VRLIGELIQEHDDLSNFGLLQLLLAQAICHIDGQQLQHPQHGHADLVHQHTQSSMSLPGHVEEGDTHVVTRCLRFAP
jgi:hypothetical protein